MRFCRERDVPSGCKKSFEQHKLRYSGNLLDMIEAIQFSSLREFFEMGANAFNVWSVYAIFAVFVLGGSKFEIPRVFFKIQLRFLDIDTSLSDYQ